MTAAFLLHAPLLVLVNKHEICERIRRRMEAVLERLRRLPQESGPQCNPAQPHMALAILQRAVDEILLTGQKALTDLG